MSVENFQVERDGETVKIWFDSGADIDRNMLAFTHEFASELEAQLVAQNLSALFVCTNKRWFEKGEAAEKRRVTRGAANKILVDMKSLSDEVMFLLNGEAK